jgi:Zn-dependent protease
MEELSTIQRIAVMAVPLVFAIVVHEVSHGWVANRLGDHTARDMGRLTLNPISHIDLFGTIIMPILLYVMTNGRFVFGYAKPVPINPYNFRDPKKHMALSSLAGPAVNIAMALACTLLLRGMVTLDGSIPEPAWSWFAVPLALMLQVGMEINVVLALLNSIPIPPLDGSRVMYWLLPDRMGQVYYSLERFGIILMLILMTTGILGRILGPLLNLIIVPLRQIAGIS